MRRRLRRHRLLCGILPIGRDHACGQEVKRSNRVTDGAGRQPELRRRGSARYHRISFDLYGISARMEQIQAYL